jgi:hypothetical protein
METFTIKFDGIELEVYAHYYKGTNQFDDKTELQAHEIRVQGVDISELLSHHTILCIEHEVVEKYELV